MQLVFSAVHDGHLMENFWKTSHLGTTLSAVVVEWGLVFVLVVVFFSWTVL